MSRDPFDNMRDRNPVPPEDEPMVPAALAERIMGTSARRARRSMPGWAIATTTAVVVLAVGGALALLTRPAAEPGFGDGGSTTTTQIVTTTLPLAENVELSAFFFAELDDDWVAGPFLVPVAVKEEVRGTAIDHVVQALAALFRGPEGGPEGTSTAIPEDTVFGGISFEEATGVVTVSVSEEFVSGGGSFSMMGRLAQVIYTATAVDGVTGVRIDVAGELTTVFGGEGIMIDDPATREGFDDLLSPVFIESPAYGANAGNPLVAFGKANTFEATLLLELTLLDGTVLWEGFTTATCGTGCWGDWQVEIPYETPVPQEAILYAFTDSMEDGSRITIRSHRVFLMPSDGSLATECSGSEATTPLEDQDGLPAAVADTREAIWAAAVSCDWEALADLAGDTLSWWFLGGDPGDPTPFWKNIEATKHPTLFMAELLTMDFGVIQSNDGVDGSPLAIFVWPAVHATGELDADASDRLSELYGEDESAWFTESGYFGYRLGIAEDGTWMFFIGGD